MAIEKDRITNGFPESTLAEAAKWFSSIEQREISLLERKQFDSWLSESPVNEAAYAAVSSAWLGPQGAEEDSYLRNARQEALQRPSNGSSSIGISSRVNVFAKAASLLVVVTLGLLLYFMDQQTPHTQSYQTLTGKQQSFQLSDGSTLILDTNTRVTVDYQDDARKLVLERGQAHFDVAKDYHRPFTVRAGKGQVTALGTAFDIRLDGSVTTVKLIEGAVKVNFSKQLEEGDSVRERRLSAGQQISLDTGSMSEVENINLVEIEAWKMGKIIFSDTPLDEAIREMNRYRNKKYELKGDRVGAIRISGIFNVDKADKFTKSLISYFPIEARESRGSTIVLSYLEK